MDWIVVARGGVSGLYSAVERRRKMVSLASRLRSILGELRAAAPTAEIIVTGAWNGDLETYAQTSPLYRTIDAMLAETAAGARARIAELAPAFNPPGPFSKVKARMWAYTFECSRSDGHPTDAGYRAIAAAILDAPGYSIRRVPAPGPTARGLAAAATG
jgi:hypothetical protein